MRDLIPAGFMTLPEALQRITVHVTEAHVESEELDFHKRVQSYAATGRSIEPNMSIVRPSGAHLKKHLATGINAILR
jgi:hypothetical protein